MPWEVGYLNVEELQALLELFRATAVIDALSLLGRMIQAAHRESDNSSVDPLNGGSAQRAHKIMLLL